MNMEIALQRSTIAKLVALYESVKNMPEPNITKPYLDTQSKIATQLWKKIDAKHSELYLASTDQSLEEYFVKDELNEAFNLYNKTLTKIESRSHKITKPTVSTIPPPTINLPENIVLNTNRNKSNIKIKPIEIPQFEGDYNKWMSFINMFDSLIHNETEFSKLQKMHYLNSCLLGEAKRIISQYSITENNYEIAYNALRSRYHNEVILINTHIMAIISQPDMQKETGDGVKELLDVTTENLDARSSLNVNTETWDPILLLLLTQKLDSATNRLWELTLKPNVRPTLKQFLDFLRERFNALGCQQKFRFSITTSDTKKSDFSNNHNHPSSYRTNHNTNYKPNQQNRSFPHILHQTLHGVTSTNSTRKNCSICNGGNHTIFQCDRFRSATSHQRNDLATCLKLCKNCLWEHRGRCKQQANCRKCGKYHHTFLHIDQVNTSSLNSLTTSNVREPQHPSNQNVQPTNTAQQSSFINTHHANVQPTNNQIPIPSDDFIAWNESVLLATAIVLVKSERDNSLHAFRCLLDQASETNYITEEVAQILGLKKEAIVAYMSGLGGVGTGSAKSVVDFEIKSKYNQEFEMKVQAPVVRKISNLLLSYHIRNSEWKHLSGLRLADPTFNTPGKIDILLGASVYGYLLLPGLIKSTPEEPIAQETELGWILSGATRSSEINHTITSFHLRIDLDNQLKKFFEQEEVSQVRLLTQEETECEEFFKKTVQREQDGRVTVALPFKGNPDSVGSSKGQAIARLAKLEARLATNSELQTEYINILGEYESLQHTSSLGNLNELEIPRLSYHLPHHAVFKPSSTTTKTRVVFDASTKTTSGVSLNELLMVGPTLQDDLTSILLRWRTHKIAFATDIQKMYRQIMVREEDRKFQRFLFRKDRSQHIQVYQHNRVVFGFAPATYLAVAALRKVANDGRKDYPEAAEIVLRDFYMDDCMSGADSIEEASKLCKDLKELLASGKFELKKFISNSTEVLETVPEEDRELKLPLEIYTENTIKTLGIHYHPTTDVFQFKVNLTSSTDWPTKRSLLSETSKLFDPLGWLAPVVIRAKILFQELWQEGLDWDQKLPERLASKWIAFRNELQQLEDIKIKRWTGNQKDIRSHELHGFSDASELAYAAVVYSRIVRYDNSIQVTMLTSKTRVAPLKPVTMPRLELCGAVLLANLMDVVGKALDIDKSSMYAWTDSTIVLGWLKEHPAKFKTFVANRIVEIHNYLNVDQWHHVLGTNNPADCASRGISPVELRSHDLWWKGPQNLKKHGILWNQDVQIPAATLEIKSTIKKSCFVIRQDENLEEYIRNYSNFVKLVRMIALQLRFINNLRSPNEKITNSILTVHELQKAKIRLIQLHQQKEFSREIHHLKNKKPISTKSKLLSLNPFLDTEDLLRLGGRLEESDLPYDRKHPLILGSGSLTYLIITDAHHRSLHGGIKLTMNLIRESLWILNLRRYVQRVISRCVTCFRFKATTRGQIMASLPRARVTESSPFTYTGVDYAGAFNIKASNVKTTPFRVKPTIINGEVIKAVPKVPTYKGYIALFICFATKAIHLEVVSDQTTKAFLAALTRFTSRRGCPKNMYSDNGSTFIGAKSILSDDREKSIVDYEKVAIQLSNDGIQWNFMPPKAPHFGGLHESGIKSMKHHLKRVVGDTTLTFEELTTVVARIESCLNSRPLCPMTDTADDLSVLTPGHFLIGRPIVAPPSGKPQQSKGSVRDRWMLIQKLQRDIWNVWSKDYLNNLQQRNKWTQQRKNLSIGNIVLVKEDDIPPTKWPLARIMNAYASKDGNIRSVLIRTAVGEYERPIHKLCVLPIIDNEDIGPKM